MVFMLSRWRTVVRRMMIRRILLILNSSMMLMMVLLLLRRRVRIIVRRRRVVMMIRRCFRRRRCIVGHGTAHFRTFHLLLCKGMGGRPSFSLFTDGITFSRSSSSLSCLLLFPHNVITTNFPHHTATARGFLVGHEADILGCHGVRSLTHHPPRGLAWTIGTIITSTAAAAIA